MTKSVLITGATGGLGRATSFALARQGVPLILVARNQARGKDLAQEILSEVPRASVVIRAADLSDLSSVSALASGLVAEEIVPRTVICNAGLQVVDRIQRSIDGFELTMATNVLGHVALLAPLLDHLRPGTRIITLGSETHRGGMKAFGFPAARWSDMSTLLQPHVGTPTTSHAGQVRYSTSKLACIAMAYELDRRLRGRGVRAVSFDPGMMPATGLAREYHPIARAIYTALTPLLVRMPGAKTVPESAADLAWLATAPEAESLMGGYVSGQRECRSSEVSYREGLGAEIWNTCLEQARIPAADD
ncbi:protochlorophyllide reductase [Arthrobacter pigmenti]|uniref:Protochlorophyllide reductase n=1 Tax=Arthrobacter pigmenti TaxID=271432 RepID=A0A846RSW8_9MICC|nr:SDR family NAD(P)-dependent oxidoreductase [Arthrobacter pigmenti]NJC22166.1 protochlorophyllide reductase [Arthrobacter pigmenti]